jgi:isoamylase
VAGETFKDIAWFTPAGTEMTDSDWQQGYARCLSVHLSGAAVHRTDPRGHAVRDENFTLLFNAHHDIMEFVVPPLPAGRRWRVELDTDQKTGQGAEPKASPGGRGKSALLGGGTKRILPARSIVLLMEVSARSSFGSHVQR